MQLPRALPRGRHALPRDVVLVSQSERLLEAIVEVVAENGYAATRVSDIVARAGVSRGTFYQQFRDKEDCFLAAYMDGSRRLFEAAEGSNVKEPDPLRRLRLATRAYLAALSAQPAWSRAFLIDIRAVAAAEAPRGEVHGWYVDLVRRWRRWAALRLPATAVPETAYEACVDADNELVARKVAQGAFGDLPGLEDSIVYIHLALLGFADHAAAIPGGER
ncbi:MAG: TetR/AcrR family transcriptional regulator [Candidatus Dormibacteraeota bacterium]|nr:TetR/AcrR family transcriptional regulator [Candidatus Dormibacteraeota bacterium]